jgi:hypothetical protein
MKTCFLCGEEADTEEHIIPKWLQNKYNLWNQNLKLPNGSTIKYKDLKIPCCLSCNNKILSIIENHIKDESANNEEIWKWAAKMHYGIFRKDDFLEWDRKNPTYKIGEIIKNDDPLEIDRHIIHSIHGDFSTNPNPFGSVYKFDFDKQYDFAFIHLINPPAICINTGNIGYVVFINDGGLVSSTVYAQKLYSIHNSECDIGKMLNFFANTWVYYSKATVSIMLVLYRKYIALSGFIEKSSFDENDFKKLWKFINHGKETEISIINNESKNT